MWTPCQARDYLSDFPLGWRPAFNPRLLKIDAQVIGCQLACGVHFPDRAKRALE